MSVVRRDSAFSLAREALYQLEASGAEEEVVLASGREWLVEAWRRFHETVERGCRENVVAQERHVEALSFMDDIRAGAIHEVEELPAPLQEAQKKVEAEREALEAEKDSKHQDLSAHERQVVEALERERAAQEARVAELAREAMAAKRVTLEEETASRHQELEGCEKRTEEASLALTAEKAAIKAHVGEVAQRMAAVALRQGDMLHREE